MLIYWNVWLICVCTGWFTNDADAIVAIPDTVIEATDERLSRTRSGELFLNDLLYHGYVVTRFANGVIRQKEGYQAGKKEGVAFAYYDDGKLRSVRYYQGGEKHGEHLGYHENGQLLFRYFFDRGFSVGNHLEWYADGQIKADKHYEKGKEYGTQRMWRPDGKLRANYIVRSNGRRYGLQGIQRCTKLDGKTKTIDPYEGEN